MREICAAKYLYLIVVVITMLQHLATANRRHNISISNLLDECVWFFFWKYFY